MDDFDLRQWPEFTSAGGSSTEPAIIDQIVIDSRRIHSPRALFVALKGEHEDGHKFIEQAAQAGAKYALVSKSWAASLQITPKIILLPVLSPLEAFQAIAQTYRSLLPTKIIGITGSFGKTMVKDLLFALLKTHIPVAASPGSFNSQIGVPLSLLTFQKKHEIGIVEAAISHPGEMDALVNMIHPNFTLLTPTGKKHLATLQNLSTLSHEIMKLIKATSPQGWSLLPHDLHKESHNLNPFAPFYFWDKENSLLPHATPLPTAPLSHYQLTFPDGTTYQNNIHSGHAYFLNLLNMAVKAAWLMGTSSQNIRSVLQHYQPEPTRTEIWKSNLGTVFINDTYCSDPQSVDRALNHFDYASNENRKIFVFGGMRGPLANSQTDYKYIGKALAKSHIEQLFLVGNQSFKPLIEEMQHLSGATEISSFNDYEETFSFLQTHLKKNDLILFKGENKISLDTLTETFNDSLSHNQCIINLAAIQTNLSLIRKRLPDKTRMMIMVKALAYGTDDIRMSKFLAQNGIDILGVSYVDEGIALKRAGLHQAIFSINAAPYEAAKVVKWDLEVGVSHHTLIDALAKEAKNNNKIIKVHLHINTGMGRFGCRPEEACSLASYIHTHPSLELEGIMTHFACAEDPQEDPFTMKQVALFDQAIEEIERTGIVLKWKHAANSSGALRFYLPQYNMVRLGLAVYGLYGSEEVKKTLDLRLAISLISRIVGINECRKGESISYGRKYHIAREKQKIAVLPIGYFDGLHRNYSGKGHVIIRGEKAAMVGNICMDNMMIDVTDIPHVAIGDKVLIFGEDEYGDYLSPEELAMKGESIVHELMTCLGPRIPRIFVYEEGKQVR